MALALLKAPDSSYLMRRDSSGKTVLHLLAGVNKPSLTALVMTLQPLTLFTTDSSGNNPYHVAAEKGMYENVGALCRFGGWKLLVPRHEVPHQSPFFVNDVTLSAWTSTGRNVINECNAKGCAPIHLAAEGYMDSTRQKCVTAIVNLTGGNANVRRMGDGYSAAHVAASIGDAGMLYAILAVGGSACSRDMKGRMVGRIVSKSCPKVRDLCSFNITTNHSDEEEQYENEFEPIEMGEASC